MLSGKLSTEPCGTPLRTLRPSFLTGGSCTQVTLPNWQSAQATPVCKLGLKPLTVMVYLPPLSWIIDEGRWECSSPAI